jgi:hypothetical protein
MPRRGGGWGLISRPRPGGLNRDRIRCVPCSLWASPHFCCLAFRAGVLPLPLPLFLLGCLPLIAIILWLSGARAIAIRTLWWVGGSGSTRTRHQTQWDDAQIDFAAIILFFFLFFKQSSSYIFFNETKISSVMKRMCRTEDVYRDSVRV